MYFRLFILILNLSQIYFSFTLCQCVIFQLSCSLLMHFSLTLRPQILFHFFYIDCSVLYFIALQLHYFATVFFLVFLSAVNFNLFHPIMAQLISLSTTALAIAISIDSCEIYDGNVAATFPHFLHLGHKPGRRRINRRSYCIAESSLPACLGLAARSCGNSLMARHQVILARIKLMPSSC